MTMLVRVGGITFTSDRSSEWILTRLSGWDDLPNAKNNQDAWPHSNGNASIGQTYYDGRSITVEGAFVPSSSSNTMTVGQALRLLRSQGADGLVLVGVKREDDDWLWTQAEVRGVTSVVGVVGRYATFQISLLSPNTAIYSDRYSQTVIFDEGDGQYGITSPLTSPLSDGSAGRSFGAVSVTGSGVAETSVDAIITGPFTEGVRLTWQNAGKVIEWRHELTADQSIDVDFDNERIVIGGQSDVSRYLTVIDWWHPTGDDVLQFEPLGTSNLGSKPTMTVEWRKAWL